MRCVDAGMLYVQKKHDASAHRVARKARIIARKARIVARKARIVAREALIVQESSATITHQQLNPENWVKLLESKCKRDASKFNVNVEASTDVYNM